MPAEIAPTRSLELLQLTEADGDRIGRFRAAARAPNTSRAYQTQLDNFAAWAKRRGLSPALPLAPAIVAAWITERAETGSTWLAAPGERSARSDSRSTLMVALAAIKAAHAKLGARFDDRDPALREAIAGVSRVARNEQEQSAPLRSELVRELLAHASPHRLHDVRDAAMLAVLYVFALRRSELEGLDFNERGSGCGTLAITSTSIDLVLYNSKAAQNERVPISIPRLNNPRAVAAIERWLATGKIEPGTPLLRRLTPAGTITASRITGDGISRAIRAAVCRYYIGIGTPLARAKELAAQYSGHSGRIGFIVSAKERGAPDTSIASVTRHKSMEMIKRYGQQAEQHAVAPHRIKGVGV